jgi:hypothetical protein
MSWLETSRQEEKMRFLLESKDQEFNFAHLCRRYGISRKTGYKLKNRYLEEGIQALEERSRAPLHHPNAIPNELVQQILDLKHRYAYWGPRTLRLWLDKNSPETAWPAISTKGDILKRYGLVKAKRKRLKIPPHTQPCAGMGVGGLGRLSIWWVKLGIMPERIEPGHPEQNGRHERMHRTLKAATTLAPGSSLNKQQILFDDFQQEYNHERPHQALGGKTPGEIYKSSTREYPSKLPAIAEPI